MTLQQFFDVLSANPSITLFYFIALPLTALLCGLLSKGNGHESPWKYAYCVLLYMAAVPGIFAIFLNVYLFLFERQSVMQMNLFTQVFPVITMLATFFIIRKNVDLSLIPGFDRLSGLVMVVAVVIGLMWILDRTRIFAVTIVPFQYVIIMLIGALIALRFGWSKLSANR
jgi:hypothetical protein